MITPASFEKIIAYLPSAAWFIFWGLLALFLVLSLVLNYHWTKYGANRSDLKRIRLIYFGFSGALFVIMFILLQF